MESIIYPFLVSPFPTAINPHALLAQQATIAWARRMQLLQHASADRRLNRLQYGMLMARAYPSAPLSMLQLVNDWSTWLFLLDDQCDEADMGHNPQELARLHAQFVDVLRGIAPSHHQQPLVHALWDIYVRLRAHAPAGWLERFSHQVEHYFAANVWEANNRRQGRIPAVEVYRTMRLFTSAVYPCLLLIEITEKLHLSEAIYTHPDLQRLAQITNNVISWSNDIVSLAKELQQGDVHNFVIALAHEQQLPLQAAVNQVAALHDAEVYAFIDLTQRLPSFGIAADKQLQRYVAGMRFWMRANIDWSLATSRYQSVPASSTVQ